VRRFSQGEGWINPSQVPRRDLLHADGALVSRRQSVGDTRFAEYVPARRGGHVFGEGSAHWTHEARRLIDLVFWFPVVVDLFCWPSGVDVVAICDISRS